MTAHFNLSDKNRIVADVAGSIGGGAARLLRELNKYVDDTQHSVQIIGRGVRLTPKWLVKREFEAPRAGLHISLNNAGFVTPTGTNVTLLRNILHFADENDLNHIGFKPSRELKLQIPIIRMLARRSETLVVPCSRMAEQVAAQTPYLQEKLSVRFHPVAQPSWSGQDPESQSDVLVPIVPQPYKNLGKHLPEFLDASAKLMDGKVRLIVPADPNALPELEGHPRVHFIGSQTSENLEVWWRRARAIFFPVEFESFGYALAEARVYGRNIIAQDTMQNREIAGGSLVGYQRHDERSLRNAIEVALSSTPIPEPEPFDPKSYFRWLLAGPGPDVNS